MRLGDYEVLSEIGRGGFAQVYRARGQKGEVVALKLLTAGSDDDYARFEREQRLLDALGEAEGFVPLTGAGLSERGPFLVMPLLAGGTLRDRLRRGPLGFEETLQLGRALATAIGWAHERGIVHRDLKPENILFTDKGRPLVADLGIAKHFASAKSASASLTEKGAFLGTPHYMAREQIDDSKTVDGRADVYALGVILYECLAGKTPYDGSSFAEMLGKMMFGDYPRIETVRAETPLHLAHPIAVALENDPELRYRNGFLFADALGARLPQRARIASTVKERPPEPRRSPWLLVAGGAGAVLLVTLAAFSLLTRSAPTPEVAPQAPNTVRFLPPTAPPVAPATPAEKGWAGEPLPPGVRRGWAAPVCVYDTGKGLELELVYVPPGDFFMGAINGAQQEKPIHSHNIAHGYYVARTEVTWGQYRAFCRASGKKEPARPSWPITDAHPVVNVTWEGAAAFCEWAGLALPTEAEWEKAARGTDTRQYPWGEEWLENANARERFQGTMPVGSFPGGISPYGALDMTGNVAEWTADWFDPSIYVAYSNGQTTPPAENKDQDIVVRGGSFRDTRFGSTVTYRSFVGRGGRDDVGFRPILRTTK